MAKNTKHSVKTPTWLSGKISIAIIFAVAALLYGNTLFHDFTLDDAIVISENEFTKSGFSGIKDLFTKDTFHGFFKKAGKDKLVPGGRYRPFTLAMFAVERAIFGEAPFFHHLVNILLYGLLGAVIFLFLGSLFRLKYKAGLASIMALSAALLFIAHPIHTEAVANIKGRDEIMALLCSLGALYLLARESFLDVRMKTYVLAATIFFIGLLSKENTITFVLIAPLAAWLYKGKVLKTIIPFFASAVLFMIIRTAVIGLDMGATGSMEPMNNPYLKIVNGTYIPYSGGEKFATICHTLWKYIQLLVVPWPLTHDYYPNHVSVKSFSDFTSILGLVVYVALGVAAILGLVKRKMWGFFAAYYLVSISIVSNIVFPIGTHMSERFIFMPSLAFLGIMPLLLYRSNRKLGLGITVLLLVVYSGVTVKRNMVWQDNFTLFTTDAETSMWSAKVNNAAGGAVNDRIKTTPDGPEKQKLILQGHGYLERALQVHPRYLNAHLLKGNLYFVERKYEEALAEYETCLRIDPSYEYASQNQFLALRAAGRYYGETKNDLNGAAKFLEQAVALRPNDFETNRLLGTCYGIMSNHEQALKYFKKCAELQPNNVDVFVNLGKAYGFVDEEEKAREAEARVRELGGK